MGGKFMGIGFITVFSMAALAMMGSEAFAELFTKKVRAKADIQSCMMGDDIWGKAVLEEQPSDQGVKEVAVTMYLGGADLPDGQHGVHIHEVASCEPTCSAAGGHYDPGPNGNSSPDGNHPFHLGDLINIDVKNGNGVMHTITSRVTLSPGPISVFDDDGSAFIVHINEDTFCPMVGEAGCAGGGRLACGIIKPSEHKKRHFKRGPRR